MSMYAEEYENIHLIAHANSSAGSSVFAGVLSRRAVEREVDLLGGMLGTVKRKGKSL